MPHDSYLSNLMLIRRQGRSGLLHPFWFRHPLLPLQEILVGLFPPRFLLRRMTRIHPPHLLAVVLAMATYGLVLGRARILRPESRCLQLPVPPFSPRNPFGCLTLSWTLGVEAQFYLLVSVFHPFLASDSPRKRRTAFTLFLSTRSPGRSFARRDQRMVLASHVDTLLCSWIASVSLSIRQGLQGGIFYVYGRHSPFSSDRIHQAFYFDRSGDSSAHCLGTRQAKLPGHSLGKISYSLYLVHLPVMVLLATWLKSLEWFTVPPDLFAIILLLAAILASLPFYLLVEKPSLNWSRKLGSGSKTSERQ